MPAWLGELDHFLDEMVEVHRVGFGYWLDTAEALDAPDHLGAVLRGALDDVQRAAHARLVHLAQQELGPPQDHGEEVVEMVRHAGGELAHGPERFAAHELSLRRLQVVHHALELLGRLLRLFQQPGIVHGIADVGHERVEELKVGIAEGLEAGRRGVAGLLPLRHIDDADHPVAHADRHANERATAVLRGIGLLEARVGLDVVHQHRLAHLHHLARDAVAHLDLGGGGHILGNAA